MATVTRAGVQMAGSGGKVLADCFGNNAAILCPACQQSPVLLIARANQRGASPSNPAKCPGCGARIHILDNVSQRELEAIHLAVRPEPRMGNKVLTIEELETTPKPLEGGGYELDDGELVYVSPNSLEQWEIIHRCYTLLKNFVDARQLGLVTADTWFEILPRGVRAPDVAFVPADRLTGIDPKRALKAVPALVIEVLGSSDPRAARRIAFRTSARLAGTARDMARRIRQYFEAGVEVVLVVDPDEREVDAYSPDEPLRTLTEHDTFEAPEILQGFSLPVAQLFE